MIKLSRLSGDEFYVNPMLIKTLEERGDTLLTFIDGERVLVSEGREEIIRKILDYKKELYQHLSEKAQLV